MIKVIETNIKDNKKTKLRFIKGSKFEMKEYLGCEQASSLLKLKLNMVDLRANYKGKYTDSLCRRCGLHEEYLRTLMGLSIFLSKTQGEKVVKVNPGFCKISTKPFKNFLPRDD